MVYELTEKDNNRVIEAKKDYYLSITLVWNPSTGYFWQEADGEAGLLEKIEHSPVNTKPGASATVKFLFRIVKSGDVTLQYSAAWAETKPPSKWFHVEVKII